MAQPDQAQFELRAELRGHVEDVRACLSCELGIVTASRDKTLRLWVEEGSSDYTCLHTYIGHTNYVVAAAYLPAGLSVDYPDASLVSGGRDTLVKVWDPSSSEQRASLQGHAYQVTAVGVLPNGQLISSSLDNTLKMWRGGKCVVTLEGHAQPVLCLAVLPTGDVLSGSGDTTVKQWSGARCVRTYTGHTDTVRALCTLPGGAGFVSGSHDMTCKVWSLGGEVLCELVGHTALVYTVAVMEAGGLIASGSEDNTARVWNMSGQCLQVLEHVGCIWSVAFTAEGDLITGCADSVARVWTTSQQRKGPPALQTAFQEALNSVKQQRVAAAADGAAQDGGASGAVGGAVPGLPPGLKVESHQVLLQPGASDGATKVVREPDGSVCAYAWDAANFKWEKIGEVVAAPSGQAVGTLKKLHKGKEWDYVFDVDVQEGAPPLKLALNSDENPYIVADRFIEEHELSVGYREQIVQFIVANTSAKKAQAGLADLPVTGGFCDPFTGGSSMASNQPPRPAQQASQPLASLPITGGFVDPFTGGGARAPAPAGVTASHQQLPSLTYFLFDNVPPLDKLAAKVREFNAQLGSSMDTTTLALSDSQAAGTLDELLATARTAAQPTNPPPALSLSDKQQAALTHMLSWPAAQLFPALDISRLLALHPTTASALTALAQGGTAGQLQASAAGGPLAAALQAAAAAAAAQAAGGTAALQTALRMVCNAFKQPALRQWVGGARESLLDGLAAGAAACTGTKAVRLGWCTVLHNYCVLIKQQAAQAGDEARLQVLSALVELLGSCPADDLESGERALQAASLLLAGDAALAQIAKDLGLQDVLRRVHDGPEFRAPAARPMLEAAVGLTKVLQ